ncbi:MAG: hypothetical protein U1F35_18290 [Steroidobacteraceae bacterium]
MFGSKSERLKLLDEGRLLLEVLSEAAGPAPEGKPVATHVRRPPRGDAAEAERLERSSSSIRVHRVPVERIELIPEEIKTPRPINTR